MTNYCSKCQLTLSVLKFSKQKSRKNGYQQYCKDCYKKNLIKWRAENPERTKELGKIGYIRNRSICLKRMITWRKNNKQYFIDYRKLHSAKLCAKIMKRHVDKLKATPKWLTKEHLEEIECYYKWAKWLTNWKMLKFQVDHIIPLKGKEVRGLHVPWNLQIISEYHNKSKGNRI